MRPFENGCTLHPLPARGTGLMPTALGTNAVHPVMAGGLLLSKPA
jgi:hypothetical protein